MFKIRWDHWSIYGDNNSSVVYCQLMVEELNKHFSRLFTREDISSLPSNKM